MDVPAGEIHVHAEPVAGVEMGCKVERAVLEEAGALGFIQQRIEHVVGLVLVQWVRVDPFEVPAHPIHRGQPDLDVQVRGVKLSHGGQEALDGMRALDHGVAPERGELRWSSLPESPAAANAGDLCGLCRS